MQCKKCGQENMDGAPACQRCGAPLGQVERSDWTPVWFGSRIIGALAVMAAVVAVVGVFIPWAEGAWTSGEPAAAHTAAASCWDLMTGGGDVEDGAAWYAITAFAGCMVLALGALWGLLDPKSKFAWTAVLAGGVAAVVGYAGGIRGVNDIVFAGAGAAEVTIETASGLSLVLAGGIAAAVTSIVGWLGAGEARPRP